MGKDTFITLAIHTYDRALIVKDKLESYGINVKLQNVNLKGIGMALVFCVHTI